jgi:hypothetical protein
MSVTFMPTGVVHDFDTLAPKVAENIVYNTLVPFCESNHVYLSKFGNHFSNEASPNHTSSMRTYYDEKTAHTLFNIERIQRAFRFIKENISATSTVYKTESYQLADGVALFQEEPLRQGDLIAAMLLNGITARFKDHVNCEFKAKVNSIQDQPYGRF